MFVLDTVVAIRTGAPRHTPSWALRSSLISLLELLLATVGAVYALLKAAQAQIRELGRRYPHAS